MTEFESDKIRSLKQKYRCSLLEKRELLDSLYPSDKSFEAELLDTDNALFTFVHKLAASAGMYGYEDLSSAARRVMNLIEQQNVDELEQAVSSLSGLLERLGKG